MLLYLIAIQTLALFCSHLVPTKITSSVLTALLGFILISAGGYMVHSSNIPDYWSWAELISPQKWLFPVLVADEYSQETIANTIGNHLCRNKQIQHQDIIVQQPCPKPNGTAILADYELLSQNHVLDPNAIEASTLIGLFLASFILFIFTFLIFIVNFRKLFIKRKKQ